MTGRHHVVCDGGGGVGGGGASPDSASSASSRQRAVCVACDVVWLTHASLHAAMFDLKGLLADGSRSRQRVRRDRLSCSGMPACMQCSLVELWIAHHFCSLHTRFENRPVCNSTTRCVPQGLTSRTNLGTSPSAACYKAGAAELS